MFLLKMMFKTLKRDLCRPYAPTMEPHPATYEIADYDDENRSAFNQKHVGRWAISFRYKVSPRRFYFEMFRQYNYSLPLERLCCMSLPSILRTAASSIGPTAQSRRF